MPNILRYLLLPILSVGLIILAIMASWVFLSIVGIIIIARMIYIKFFYKGKTTIHSNPTKPEPWVRHLESNPSESEQNYTTVIDADHPDQEYKIPKI